MSWKITPKEAVQKMGSTSDNIRDIANKVIEHGGTIVGALTEKPIKNIGDLIFQYVADPVRNIIEIHSWNKSGGLQGKPLGCWTYSDPVDTHPINAICFSYASGLMFPIC